MEGASSDLRTGLPQQMIEIHEPMRLLVVLEQTRAVVSAIYHRQPPLQELIGNGWIIVAVKGTGERRDQPLRPGARLAAMVAVVGRGAACARFGGMARDAPGTVAPCAAGTGGAPC